MTVREMIIAQEAAKQRIIDGLAAVAGGEQIDVVTAAKALDRSVKQREQRHCGGLRFHGDGEYVLSERRQRHFDGRRLHHQREYINGKHPRRHQCRRRMHHRRKHV